MTLHFLNSNGMFFPVFNIPDVMHCFELRTANLDYFVGEDPLFGTKDPTKITMPPQETGIGSHLAKSWETAIRQALMPVTPQGNSSSVPGPARKKT